MSSVSEGTERTISRLEAIQKQFSKAATMADMALVKTRFDEFLDSAQTEMLKQQSDISEIATGAIAGFRRIQK